MAKKNFTITTVATAPSPAKTGTSLVVASGDGSLFAVNEPAIIFPVNDQPLVANAEIVMVTNVATDTLTITRTQESTSARTIVAGDIIIQGITAKDWNDLVTLVAGKITAFADPNADRIVFWDESAGAFAALTASTGLTLSGTNLTVRAASETATGIVERATDAEFTGGTDTTRFINAKQAASVAQTMTNKTLTSPVIDTGVSGTAVLDEDNMASNSATQLATQQSIKAYVDAQGFTWKGAWVTSTPYAVNDTVENDGSGYICTAGHTSGASTEPGVGASWADKWDLFVEGIGGNTVPSGTVSMFAGSSAPTGYLMCDGSAVSRTTYANLFTAISTTWGVGNGSTTFNIPDMRGVFPKGAGTTSRTAGKDASGTFYTATLGTYLTDKMQGHYHTKGPSGIYAGAGGNGYGPTGATGGSDHWAAALVLSPSTDGTNGTPRVGHTTEPQSVGINYIIKT